MRRLPGIVICLLFAGAAAVLAAPKASPAAKGPKAEDGPLPGMQFQVLTGGAFLMGTVSSAADSLREGRHSDESPSHRVTLSPFAMMSTEVTQAQWSAVMGQNPARFKGEQRPVEQVSWRDVQAFIAKLNQLHPGRIYRLPTEAEWEFACRAGSTGPWSCPEPELSSHAVFRPTSSSSTQPVKSRLPNAWGLFDMHGNVWEWCSDLYGAYGSEADVDPQGPSEGVGRVARGGCWYGAADEVGSAVRFDGTLVSKGSDVGFRLCFTP
jgi:formylglycine-generating enzyme required for sulfatase activity